ncbi:unnamed protein product [Brassica oleracea]
MRHCHSFVQFIYTCDLYVIYGANWYCYGNMVAEQSAWETQKAKGVD